jgi:CRISPR/Cas system CMR-associated protein Cmr5 small subunit
MRNASLSTSSSALKQCTKEILKSDIDDLRKQLQNIPVYVFRDVDPTYSFCYRKLELKDQRYISINPCNLYEKYTTITNDIAEIIELCKSNSTNPCRIAIEKKADGIFVDNTKAILQCQLDDNYNVYQTQYDNVNLIASAVAAGQDEPAPEFVK